MTVTARVVCGSFSARARVGADQLGYYRDMNSKLFQTLLIVTMICVVYTSWTVATLRSDVATLQWTQNSQRCPSVDLQALNAPLLQTQKNQVSMTGALSYAELLLEGIARNAGLPIEEARQIFSQRPGGIPEGWTWLESWETAKATP